MDTIEKAALLFGKGQKVNQGAAHSANVTTITGIATSDSVDGTVTVDVGGTTISYDDNQSVELPTTCDVRDGDTVQIKVAGSDGSAKSLMVDGVVAGGDRAKAEFATQINSVSESVSNVSEVVYGIDGQVLDLSEKMDSANMQIVEIVSKQLKAEQTEDEFRASVTALEKVTEGQSETLKEFTEWVTFDETGMAIGNSDSGRKVKINEQVVEFDNAAGDVVARFAEKAEIHDLEIADGGTFTMGNWAWIPRSNGNLSLKWIGGN